MLVWFGLVFVVCGEEKNKKHCFNECVVYYQFLRSPVLCKNFNMSATNGAKSTQDNKSEQSLTTQLVSVPQKVEEQHKAYMSTAVGPHESEPNKMAMMERAMAGHELISAIKRYQMVVK